MISLVAVKGHEVDMVFYGILHTNKTSDKDVIAIGSDNVTSLLFTKIEFYHEPTDLNNQFFLYDWFFWI